MQLPIELIPNSDPPRFRWKQVVRTPIGVHKTQLEGVLSPSIEGAVVTLINMTKQLVAENEELRSQLAGAHERIATQCRALEKCAEVPTTRKGK